MALRPIIDKSGFPQLYPSEQLIETYRKSFATIDFVNGSSIVKNSGTTYLTNARIIFIHDLASLYFENFALHLNLITEEQFASSGQSVSFQANINPYSTFMPSAGKVRIDIEGYTKNFQSQTTNFMRQIRMVVSSPAVQVTNVGNQAFINPNDPDTLIVVNK